MTVSAQAFVAKLGVLAGSAIALAAPSAASAATFEPAASCPPMPEGIEEHLTANNTSCGYLVVPENRATNSERTIRLLVAIVPAKSPTPAPDPIVFLVGGPGGAAVTQIRGAVKGGMNDTRDVIFLEQRGTRFSEPELTCPELGPARLRTVGRGSYDAKTRRSLLRAVGRCRARLLASGIDLSAYNTTENAADLADLRVAMGIPVWNVYGGSYGTDLGITYSRDHPEGIRSVVIDSIVPPDVASLSWTWTDVEDGTGNLFRACKAQRACAKRYPRLAATFNRLVGRLERDPVTMRIKDEEGKRVKVLVDGAALVNWITEATTNEPAEVPAAIDAAARGRPRAVAEARLAATDPGIEASGMQLSVLCSEWIPYEPFSAIRKQGRRSFPGLPKAVRSQAPGLPFLANGACREWAVPTAPPAIRAPAAGSLPTLVLGGTFDALTGDRWARYVAGQLPNSTLVIVPAAGHGALFRDPCPTSIFASFLANPAAPDTSCVPGMKPASGFQFNLGR